MSIPGSRWWRFDLHNHSPASSDYCGDKSISPQDWLLNYMRAGIDAVAITDHNCASWIDQLQASLGTMQSLPADQRPEGYRDLVLFPGVELTAQDGIHLLAIFDPSVNSLVVAGLLGSVECPHADQNHSLMCSKGSVEIAKAVLLANGLVIAAHIDQKNGLFEAEGVESPTLKRRKDSIDMLLPLLSALQVVDRSAPQLASALPDLEKRFALIAASDAHKPSHVARASTWIKCTAPTLQGLRLAFLDHHLAVRRADANPDDPNTTPKNWLRCIRIHHLAERQAEPLKVNLNPGFNALIGGRGTGKSTLIEATRLAGRRGDELEKLGENSEVKAAFTRFQQRRSGRNQPGMLLSNSIIQIVYVRDGEEFLLTSDQAGEAPAVRQREIGSNEWSEIQGLTPAQIAERFPLRILSQKQVFELSRSPRALLELIDRDPRSGKADWQRQFDEGVLRFKTLRAQHRALSGTLSVAPVREDELRQINLKLKAFEQGNYGAQLKAYQVAQRQQSASDDAFVAAERYLARLQQALHEAGEIAALSLSDFDMSDPDHAQVVNLLQRVAKSVAELPMSFQRQISEVERSVQQERQALDASGWRATANLTSCNHDTLLAQMREVGIDGPKAYGELGLRKQALERELKTLHSERSRLATIAVEIAEIRNSLISRRRNLTQQRQEFIKTYIEPSSQLIRLTISEAGDKSSAEDEFRKALAIDKGFESDIRWGEAPNSCGLISEIYHSGDALERWAQAMSDLDSTRESALGSSLGAKLVTRLKERTKNEQFDEALCVFPEDKLKLEYRQGNNFKKVDQGSAGQRSAAVLSFLLAFGEEPMLLDQPEDDLDNALVYELVVQGIRDNKARRQLIVSTHNANIVVNGDAEYVVAMRYENGGIDAELAASGGLQEESVRRKICDIMEGGPEAFEKRYKKVLMDLPKSRR